MFHHFYSDDPASILLECLDYWNESNKDQLSDHHVDIFKRSIVGGEVMRF